MLNLNSSRYYLRPFFSAGFERAVPALHFFPIPFVSLSSASFPFFPRTVFLMAYQINYCLARLPCASLHAHVCSPACHPALRDRHPWIHSFLIKGVSSELESESSLLDIFFVTSDRLAPRVMFCTWLCLKASQYWTESDN